MARDLMKIVREWEAEREAKRRQQAVDDEVTSGTLAPQIHPENLPWPGYNGGVQFVCDHCGVHFDTSAGFAKHQLNEHSEEKQNMETNR
jgi:hypothetical protein